MSDGIKSKNLHSRMRCVTKTDMLQLEALKLLNLTNK